MALASTQEFGSCTRVAALVLTLLAAISFSTMGEDPAAATATTDPRLAQAQSALDRGQIQPAHGMFLKLLQEMPENEQVNFGYGMVCAAEGDNSKAKLAFERVLEINPGNDRARAELARCLMRQKQYSQSREQFKRILKNNPPDPVRRNIESCLRQIDSEEVAWSFQGRLNIGVFKDNNVNVGPDSDIINISPIVYGATTITQLTVGAESKPTDANGMFYTANLTGIYDLGEPAGWTAAFDGMAYFSMVEGFSRFNSAVYQFSAGLRRITDKTMLSLPAYAGRVTSGNDPLMDMLGSSPSITYSCGPSGSLRLSGGVDTEKRNYATANDRDSLYVAASASARYAYGLTRGNSFGLSAALFRDKTEAKAYENSGWSLTGNAEAALRWRLTLYGKCRAGTTDYAEKEPLAPETRADRQLQFAVGLRKPFENALTVDVNQQWTKNESTFDLYEYDRSVTSASLRYDF